MRPIDADALIADLAYDVQVDEDSLVYEDLSDDNRTIIQFDKDCKQNAIDILNHAPTIVPERRTGRWERVTNSDNGIDFRCSACHRYRFHNGGMRKKYKFCPACGAKMEVENDSD